MQPLITFPLQFPNRPQTTSGICLFPLWAEDRHEESSGSSADDGNRCIQAPAHEGENTLLHNSDHRLGSIGQPGDRFSRFSVKPCDVLFTQG